METLTLFRYPDKPLESGPGILATLKEGDWLCQFKYDGFRALLDWDGDRVTLTSRHAKPLPASPDLIDQARRFCRGDGTWPPLAAGTTLDAEWTGRRAGTPEALWLFDVLRWGGGVWLGERGALERYALLETVCARGRHAGTERVRLVDCRDRDYAELFEISKGYPETEGIVLKRRDSRFIGSTRKSAENPAWLKVKWRGGEAGETML